MKLAGLLLLLPISAYAANHTVKAGGGGDFTTIQACATAMAAGDSCTVFAGTYNETVTISAGTIGNYKILTVNPGDTVNVLGFSQGSHTKINGFHISNTSSPNSSCTSSGGATDFYITNNVMVSCGGINGLGTSHGFIQGNTLSYAGNLPGQNNNGPGISLHGDFLLMEHNDISHVSDGLHFGGSHFVFRNNTMHDTLASECGSGSDNGGNCHIDYIEAEPNIATSFNLYENNTEVNNIGGNAHGFLLQADVCGGNCRTTIVRFNQLAHVNSAGLENDNIWQFVKSYNNDWVDVGSGTGGGIGNSCINGATNCGYFNELFYYPGSTPSWNAIATSGTSSSTFSASHNLAFCVGSCASLSGYQYGAGHWLDDPTNLLADPQFVSYSSTGLGNLSLQSTSPARNSGTFLTKVNGSVSGSTSLVVNDANFFQDGSGITGVNGDCISVTTITNHVCITAVNYTTNTLTLASPISAANGDPVYIYSISDGTVVLTDTNGPDIGAVSFSAIPTVATPTASPAAGTYSGAIYATLSTITSGAAICYTLDGTTPTASTPGTCNGLTYSTPILIPSTTTVKAIGTQAGLTNSAVSSTAYTINNTTWYVDPVNGGPRYSPQNATAASCDGRSTAAFNPTGPTNQHCPYQVGRYLWNDVFTYNNTQWIIQGGDTVEFRNADATHPTEFSGSTGNFGDGCWGIGPQCSPPPIPDGTSGQHTVLRGQNYAACSTTNSLGITVADPTKISYLWAGGGTGQLFDLSTSHYVDISCMQLRDHSSCNGINLSCSGTEWAGRGIWTGATATPANITLTNMQITGFQSRGIIGNIGGPWTLNNVEISFNGSAGWDLDPGFGNTRDSVNGVVVMNNTIVSWNGCSRQWPDVNPVPVQALSCTYDTDGGYGDGIGTPPDVGILSWTLNHSLLSYNTQDAIDLGHLLSGTVIYTGNILFGNAGGAMKVGNATNLTEWNNFSEGNCTAMAQPIAGAVSNYNAVISGQNIDLCRAGGDQNTFNYDPTLGHTLTADVEFNTFVGTGATVMDAQCFNGPCVPVSGYTFKFSNNAVLGYTNSISSPTPPYPYNSGLAPGMFNNLSPTTQANNLFSGLRSCPANGSDISPTCALSPAFVSQPASPITAESQLANFNFLPAGGSALIHAAVFNASVPLDYYGVTRPNPPSVGAAEPAGGTVTVATPTAAPAAGTYGSTQNVVLSTTTGGAFICYRTDGTNPAATTPGTCDAGSTTYAGAISVPVTTTIKALGTLSGATNSSVASFAYVISTPATATPTCTPAGGTYSSTQSVTCSSTTAASTTFCTVDGSTPTTSSPVCTAIPVASTLAVRAISSASGFTNSAILTQNYTITTSTVATPTALPGSGTFSTPQSVALSNTTSGAAICFTMDGSTPTAPTAGTCSGGTTQTYSTAIPVSTTTTINCLGTKAGSLNSPMANFVYTIGPNQVTLGGSITITGKVPLQ